MLNHRLLVVLAALAPAAAASEPLRVPTQFPTIQAAIDAAHPGAIVIVADGVYTGVGNRDLNFGGKNLTVRSANGAARCIIDCQASAQDPYRGFLFENGETRAAVLDGFTIQNAATLEGAVADPFNGAAIRIRNGASPTIANCVFQQNNAGCWGGGVYVGFGGNPLIERCMFQDNVADDGGGFFSWQGGNAEIVSCVFVGNHANATGGAIALFGGGGRLVMRNCTVVQNTAPGTGGLADFGFGSTITSSIIWGNGGSTELIVGGSTTLTYCCVEGGHPGVGNMSENPLLGPDGYHLRRRSPCRNAGDPALRPLDGRFDIDGEQRVLHRRVDIGADELGGDGLPTIRAMFEMIWSDLLG